MASSQRGGARPGAGRPAGIPNKHHVPKTTPTWIRLTEEEKAKLKAKAEKEEISVSEFIRNALLKYL